MYNYQKKLVINTMSQDKYICINKKYKQLKLYMKKLVNVWNLLFIYIKLIFASKVYIKSKVIFVFYNEINDFANYFAYKIIKIEL